MCLFDIERVDDGRKALLRGLGAKTVVDVVNSTDARDVVGSRV